MSDVQKEKYMKMMAEVEQLEDRIEELENNGAPQKELKSLQEDLAAKKHELQRVSDGCGPGRGV